LGLLFNANLLEKVRVKIWASPLMRSFINLLLCAGMIAKAQRWANCSFSGKVLEQTNESEQLLGLLGRKVGMMRLFTDDGDASLSRCWMCPTTA
jgi:hypothetical protein